MVYFFIHKIFIIFIHILLPYVYMCIHILFNIYIFIYNIWAIFLKHKIFIIYIYNLEKMTFFTDKTKTNLLLTKKKNPSVREKMTYAI